MNTQPRASTVVVVADGGCDDSWRVAEKSGVRVIRRSEAGGPGVARNVGARIVRKDDILFFVDADVTVRTDAVKQVAHFFTEHPTITAIFGSYDDQPMEQNFLSQYKNLLHHYVHQTAHEEASTFWGACGAIRSDIFHAMGGFDESYGRPSIEDIELGIRLTRCGHQIRLCKTLQVTHLKRWKVKSLLKADIFDRALPWTEVIHREGNCVNDLNLKHSARWSVFLIYITIIAACAAFWSSPFLLVGAFSSVALLVLNAPLYHFFQRKRGAWFAIRAISWHALYYFYSGMAFLVGTVRYWVRSVELALSAVLRALPDPPTLNGKL